VHITGSHELFRVTANNGILIVVVCYQKV